MQLLKGLTLDDFEWETLTPRLIQYCQKTDIRVPSVVDDKWVINELCNQHLVSRIENEGGAEKICPTRGGYLLFAVKPQNHIQSAQVIVRVKGDPEWIESVFNDSRDDEATVEGQLERIVEGNLWGQLDVIYDILSLVNQPFLLKDEISTTVQPYPPAALREMIVNALVHRDYARLEPIIIEINQTCIHVHNPGGLVPEVIRQVESAPNFEKEIKGGKRGITDCRNRVVSDLFYGAETMEKAGSGLSDIWRSANENQNDVNFGPTDDNTAFQITIHCRPEAVDSVTKTAYHRNFVRYASNFLEVVTLPKSIWHAGTKARKAKDVWERTESDWLPPFITHAKADFHFS